MKLFTTLAAALVAGSSFVAAAPVEAKPQFTYVGSDAQDMKVWTAVTMYGGDLVSHVNVYVEANGTQHMMAVQTNCAARQTRYVLDNTEWSRWFPIRHNSVGNAVAEVVCS